MAPDFCLIGALLFQTIKREMPIIKYNEVHTGPNTQAGGFHEGLITSVLYQLVTLETVKNPEMPPTICGIAIEMTAFDKFFIIIETFV